MSLHRRTRYHNAHNLKPDRPARLVPAACVVVILALGASLTSVSYADLPESSPGEASLVSSFGPPLAAVRAESTSSGRATAVLTSKGISSARASQALTLQGQVAEAQSPAQDRNHPRRRVCRSVVCARKRQVPHRRDIQRERAGRPAGCRTNWSYGGRRRDACALDLGCADSRSESLEPETCEAVRRRGSFDWNRPRTQRCVGYAELVGSLA